MGSPNPMNIKDHQGMMGASCLGFYSDCFVKCHGGLGLGCGATRVRVSFGLELQGLQP